MAARAPREEAGAEDSGPSFRKSALRDNFESIVIAVLFAVFVRAFIAQPYKIPSGSMEDNLLVGDHLVVNKVAYGDGPASDGPGWLPTRPARRGDIVIFRPPHDDATDYIKRIIGLPGEDLRLVYDEQRNGVRVHVDGVPLPENYRNGHFAEPVREEGARWTVTYAGDPPEARYNWSDRRFHLGEGQYFMMGDNRNDSADSRFWPLYGASHAVEAERMRGLAWFIYWSYDVRDDDPEPKGLGKRIVHYVKIATTFATRTRWSRSFDLIE
jgi:signal peptidase I